MKSIIPDTSAEFYNPATFSRTDSVAYLCKLLNISFSRAIDSQVADLDLTAMQWRPIMVLSAQNKPCTISTLAMELNVDAAAVTRMLDRLHAKQLVERVRCEKDRRVIYIKLTEAGHALVQQIPPRIAAAIAPYLESLTPQEVEQFKTIAQKMLVPVSIT